MEQQEALLDEGPPSPRPPSPSPTLPPTEGPCGSGDSSSAGSGVALGPMDQVSAQLINNITMLDYRSLGNSSPLILDQEDLSKSEVLAGGVSAGKLPNFVTWNWTMIRAVLFWGVLSGLLACLATVIALVASLPRTCDPLLPWYQGGLFYEVFPASFQDSNGDGIGDLRGLTSRVDYLKTLGVRAVRLNSIFTSEYYPDRYKNVSSLMDIDGTLGSLRDLGILVTTLHDNNISLILDLPVHPFVTRLNDVESVEEIINSTDKSEAKPRNSSRSVVKVVRDDRIATAIHYWVTNGVDGFFLKGLEHLVQDPYFSDHLRAWKKIVGSDRILIVSNQAVLKAKGIALNMLMLNTDLVDVFLDVTNGTEHIKSQVENVLRGELWAKPGRPWAHWSVGSDTTRRLSSSLSPNHTKSALLLNMMLPGTPNIFYGDEIGLREISEPEEDFHESEHTHNLVPMIWPTERQFSASGVLPWVHGNGAAGGGREISELAALRPRAPPIYLNAVWKEGMGLPNIQIRHVDGILAVERWYPRRNTYLLLINFGDTAIGRDLSCWYYGGTALVATDVQLEGHSLVFKELVLRSAEAMVVKMEK